MTTELTDEQINGLASPYIRSVGDHWASEQAIADDGSIEGFARAAIAADRAARIGEFPALPKPDHATVSPWDKDAIQMVFFTADQMRAYATQAVEADREARGVPDGWQIVPKVATTEMILALMGTGLRHAEYKSKAASPSVGELRDGYCAALAAAPQPAAQPERKDTP